MKKLVILIISTFILTGGCMGFAQQPSAQNFDGNTEAKLYYNEGVDFYKLGQYDRAMDSFRQAISTDPNYINAYYNLGSILEFLKQDGAALETFKQIIVRKPDDYEALYKAAKISERLGNPQGAKSYLSLIPAGTPAYNKAQELTAKMNANAQTSQTTQPTQTQAQEQTVSPSAQAENNEVFENIMSPTGITSDNAGNIYVACFSDNTIYKITPDGKRILYLKDARISGPIGMTMDSAGNLYIANYNKDNIIKVTNGGQVSILLGNVSKPYSVHIKGNSLFISSQGSNSIVKYVLK